jgi:hypothetical protein
LSARSEASGDSIQLFNETLIQLGLKTILVIYQKLVKTVLARIQRALHVKANFVL